MTLAIPVGATPRLWAPQTPSEPLAQVDPDPPSLQPAEIARLARQFTDDSSAIQRLWCLERDVITGFRGYVGQESLVRAGLEMAYFNRPRDVSINITQPLFRNASSQLETEIPSWDCRPASNSVGDMAKAQADAQMLRYFYTESEVQGTLQEVVDWTIIFGTAATLTSMGQNNDVVVDAFGPDRIRAEPGIANPDKSRFLGVTRITTRDALLRRFPDKADIIAQAPRPQQQINWWDGPMQLPEDRVEVLEAYCRSGHWYMLVGAQGGVLAQGRMPGRAMPVNIFRYTPLPFEFWGMGMVEQALPTQYAYSSLWNQILANARLTTNPKYLIHKNSGIAPDAFSARPGEKVYWINQKPEVLQPGTLPNYMQQLPAAVQSALADSTGIHQSSQGKRTPGLATGAAINAITANDQVQFGITRRDIHKGVVRIGKTALLLMRAFYPDEKIVRQFDRYGSAIAMELRASDLSDNPDVFVEADTLFKNDVQARQERVMEFARMGSIPPDKAIELLQNNIDPLKPQKPIADYVDAKRALDAVVRQGYAYPDPTRPPMPDGQPAMRPTVQFYASDNLQAFGDVARQFIRSDDFYRLLPDKQDAVDAYYREILRRMAPPPAESNDPAAQGDKGKLANAPKAPQKPGLPAGATPGDATGNAGGGAHGTSAEREVAKIESAAEGSDEFSR
jgi:hypothetical protein